MIEKNGREKNLLPKEKDEFSIRSLSYRFVLIRLLYRFY